jgi:Domain of unknown function (DUF5063)
MEKSQLDAIHQFASTAEAYCTLLETHNDLTDEEFVIRCAATLAALYRAMLALPEIDDSDLGWRWDEEKAVRMKIPTVNFYKSLYDRLETKQHDRYWFYFDPFDSTSNLDFPLSMTLLEIYEDVRLGLESYRSGTERDFLHAADYWLGMALVHWGQHVTDALRVLHEIIVDDWNKRPSTDQAEDEDDDRSD